MNVGFSSKRIKSGSVILAIALIVSLPWLSATASESGNEQVEVTRGTRAKVIEKVPPHYPSDMASRRIEGWVEVGFIVAKDGTTRDIRILNNSEKLSFDNAAIRAVSRWKFKPATMNGEPVEETRVRQRITFMIEGVGQGVSRRFKSGLKRAYDDMDEGDMDSARKQIDQMDKRKQYLLSESCWIDIAEGDYWKKAGDQVRAVRHFERALVIADDILKPSAYHQLLRSAILLNAELGNLAKVLDHYKTLVEADPELAEDDPVHGIERKIRAYIEGDQPFATAAEIKPPCDSCGGVTPTYYQKLQRDRFTLTEVEGAISELKFLCGNSNATVGYQPDIAWELNRDWGECWLQVIGEPGSTFNVVEL